MGPSASAKGDVEAAAADRSAGVKNDFDDELDDRDDEAESSSAQRAGREDRAANRNEAPARAARVGFLEVYKPSQGRRIRMATGVCAAVLIVWCAIFLFEKLSAFELGRTEAGRYLQFGLSGAVVLFFGGWTFHLLGRSARVVDFLIATEGEMKKVHWTSRREVIGSTRVVIFVMVVLAAALFVIDLGLMVFFTEIGVLRIGGDLIAGMLGGS